VAARDSKRRGRLQGQALDPRRLVRFLHRPAARRLELTDGATWTVATKEAPWTHSDLPMTLVFDDRMWLMGGGIRRLPATAQAARSGPQRGRDLDAGDEEGRLESANRRRGGGLQGAHVDHRRHGRLLLRDDASLKGTSGRPPMARRGGEKPRAPPGRRAPITPRSSMTASCGDRRPAITSRTIAPRTTSGPPPTAYTGSR